MTEKKLYTKLMACNRNSIGNVKESIDMEVTVMKYAYLLDIILKKMDTDSYIKPEY